MKTIYTIILLFLLSTANCITHTVNVDGTAPYTSIQSAIDASVNGDTVLVYPGRYLENLTIQNKRIILCSREMTTGNPIYIGQTIIDGHHAGSCIVLHSAGYSSISPVIVRGFTVINGQASMGESIFGTQGGGVQIRNNSFAYIINNRINNNAANSGGGIAISSGSMVIEGNSIQNNIASALGGGIFIEYASNVTFDESNRCSIYGNFCGSGSDLLFDNFDTTPTVYADTISVFANSTYFIRNEQGLGNISPLPSIVANHAYISEINHDLYVSPDGNDNNDGLSSENPLHTIAVALQRIASDSLNPKTVYLAPGEYRQSEGQIFPIQLKQYVNLVGNNCENTKIIFDDALFPTNGIVGRVIEDIVIHDITIDGSDIQGCAAIGLDPDNPTEQISIYNIEIKNVNSLTMNLVGSSLSVCYGQNVVITNSSFHHNRANGAAGISLYNSSGLITNCNFHDNIADDLSHDSVQGCDISAQARGDLTINHCIFSSGQTTFNNPEYLRGIVSVLSEPGASTASNINIDDCVFSNCHAAGGAAITLSCESPGRMNLTNCTFANNTALETATVLNGQVNVANCIFNNPTNREIMLGYPGAYGVASHLNVEYSDVRGGLDLIPYPQYITWGEGNVTDSPLFASTNPLDDNYLYLAEGSPCIDTGTPDTLGLSLTIADLAGNYRIWNNRIDMGCYEYGSEPVGNEDDVQDPEVSFTLTNYPNPFNPSTVISCNLKDAATVRLNIYNIRGQHVKTLVNERMNAGTHTVVWNGTDDSGQACASGVYFSRLTAGDKVVTRKMALIK